MEKGALPRPNGRNVTQLTLERIAELAGVSRSTASRVLNQHPSVRPEVRERVWQVVQAHDYQPHQAARALASRRTNTIGLVIPETVARLFADPFFALLTQGIASICNQHGYFLALTLMTDSTDHDTLYRRILRSSLIDGVIVASATLDDPITQRLQESRHPCIIVGRHPDCPDIPWVDVDNVAGAKSMVEHLIALGHRRIATITGPLNTGAGRDRLEGYRQALTRASIVQDGALVTEGDFTEESGFYAMKRLMRTEPTAVFAASDMMAIGAMKALAQAGRRVPKDVSVAGYDDIPAAMLVEPQLTTVQQVVVDLGRVAAEKLMDFLENREAKIHPQLLSTHLVIRDSTRLVNSN